MRAACSSATVLSIGLDMHPGRILIPSEVRIVPVGHVVCEFLDPVVQQAHGFNAER